MTWTFEFSKKAEKQFKKLVLSQAVHEDTVHLSMGTMIQQGPRIAGRQFLSRSQIASCESYAPPQCHPKYRRLK